MMLTPGEKWLVCLVPYAVAAILTIGWAFHRDCAAERRPIACAAVAGVAWPAYWSGKAAIELFRPGGSHAP